MSGFVINDCADCRQTAIRVDLDSGGQMTTPRSLSIGVAAIASIAVVGILSSSAPADAQNPYPGSAPVNIVSSVPLNVSGNVALVPGGAVEISNAPENPIPVYDVSKAVNEPFQHGTVTASFSSSSANVDIITVPAGKRLVIEHVSAWINASGPDGLAAITIGIAPGGPFDQPLCQQVGKTATGLNHFFQCASTTKFYAESGQTVRFFVSLANSDGGFHRVFVSGYYEPVP
jgi:hypothetical protein